MYCIVKQVIILGVGLLVYNTEFASTSDVNKTYNSTLFIAKNVMQ